MMKHFNLQHAVFICSQGTYDETLMMEHISNLNPKSGDDLKSTTGENSKIAETISTSQCV
jgi:hypothetical protein